MNTKIIFLVLVIATIFLLGCATNKTIDEDSQLEDFYGKPSIILFGSTTCPHCNNAMPIFKEQVYDVYGTDVNIWVNVINKERFPYDIPQGFNANLDFNKITGENCQYVPSWLVLDKDGNVVLSSCGSDKTMDDMIAAIEELS